MQPSQRVLVNTAAQYTRTVINILLSLYSTRLVLEALGKSDYGIFQLVGGVVAMLGFLTNAMVITTQRHLSYAHGRGGVDDVRRIFSNSLLLHLLIGVGLVVVLAALTPWLVDYLEIAPDRRQTAQWVYLIALLTLFLTFIVAPFRALFIARENIVYISCIDVLDGVLKVLFVIWFLGLFGNRLLTYTALMSALMLFNLMAFSVYARLHYAEVCLIPSRKDLSLRQMKEITGFAGWTTYSMGCIIARNQGMALVLNKVFCNTVINAAYGLAMQVASAAGFVSQSILNAMSPQIIKAEGVGDRRRMLSLAGSASKYAFLLLAMAVVPLIAEMRPVLDFWLGEGAYPSEAVFFCRIILISAVCDQLTIGLGAANQAIGKIRNYSLTINTIKVLTLPVVLLLLLSGIPLERAMWAYVIIELVSALLRLPFLHQTAGLSVGLFMRHVFVRVSVPLLSIVAVCLVTTSLPAFPLRFLLTLASSVIVGMMSIWCFGCESQEQEALLRMIRRKRN